ncbi:MAG: 50S ribosomal protein L16 [Dissulfurimicrobium sp.]|uniref:50S ribosomal protein L16 n=1 Tax=Dissulfurimicrobium TaxID=1769732 RepID=UPI001EDBA7EC|nr:50S ribosomal protein L16 [Dissulfurimicrobium hydrothermale]UKL14327.1 50S ribosomal protein L16 [Dissulfurimicrobium hydrothermale]
MLSPKKTKYRKQQKGRIGGVAYKGSTLAFGDFGLKATKSGRITAQQIEAARIAINRFVRRRGKVWIRVFPDKPVSKKPAETRMGSGKGPVEMWIAPVRAGRILYEMEGVDEASAREAFRLAAHKLSIPTKFVSRSEVI